MCQDDKKLEENDPTYKRRRKICSYLEEVGFAQYSVVPSGSDLILSYLTEISKRLDQNKKMRCKAHADLDLNSFTGHKFLKSKFVREGRAGAEGEQGEVHGYPASGQV